MADKTLEVHEAPSCGESCGDCHQTIEERLLDGLKDAIDLASDQDGTTWLTDRGKRIAAIVPVEHAERGQLPACPRFTMGAAAPAGSVLTLTLSQTGRLIPLGVGAGTPYTVLANSVQEGDVVELRDGLLHVRSTQT